MFATSESRSGFTKSQHTDVSASPRDAELLGDNSEIDELDGDLCVEPAWLSGRANGLLGVEGVPTSLAAPMLLPAREPGLANGDELPAVPC